jgi:hypothetical protein
MGQYLLIGAGFSRNWGGPLSDEITGSLLGELLPPSPRPLALSDSEIALQPMTIVVQEQGKCIIRRDSRERQRFICISRNSIGQLVPG